MKEKKTIITGILLIVLSLVLALGVKFPFHACMAMEEGATKGCILCQNTVFYMGLGMTLVSLAGLLVKNSRVRGVLYILVTAAALAAIIIPNNVIRLCMMPDMRCNRIMRPAIIIISACIVIAGIISLVFAFGKEKKNA